MNIKKPFFSIITPIYNGKEYIPSYINSLKKQTFTDFEALIIDDGSNDGSINFFKILIKDDNRFKILKQKQRQKIKGPYLARNMGIEKAKGEYICFLDIDDYWKPNKLERQYYLIKQNRRIKLIFGSYIRSYKNKSVSKIRHPFLRTGLKNIMQYANVIPMLTTCIKREVIDEIRFKPINHEDYVFWLEVIHKLTDAEIKYDRKLTTIYNIHKKSLSSSKIKAIFWIWKIYRLRGYSKFKALGFIFIRFFIQIFIISNENISFLKDESY